MKLEPRARLIILEGKAAIRDSEAAQRIYSETFRDFPNAEYAGFIAHRFGGPNPAHNYLFNNATAEQIGQLNEMVAAGVVNGRIQLERYGLETY